MNSLDRNSLYGNTSIIHSPVNPTQSLNTLGVPIDRPVVFQMPKGETLPFYGPRENNFAPAVIAIPAGVGPQTNNGSTLVGFRYPQEAEERKVQFDENVGEIPDKIIDKSESEPEPEPEPEPVKPKPKKVKNVEAPKSPKRERTQRRSSTSSSSSTSKPKSIMKETKKTETRKTTKKTTTAKKAPPKIVEDPKAKLIECEVQEAKCCGCPSTTCAILCTVFFVIALIAALVFLGLFLAAVFTGYGGDVRCDIQNAKDSLTPNAPLVANPFPNAYYSVYSTNGFNEYYYLLEGETNQLGGLKSVDYGYDTAINWHCGVPIKVMEMSSSSSSLASPIYLGKAASDPTYRMRYTYVLTPGYRYSITLEPPMGIFQPQRMALVSLQRVQRGEVRIN